ncbi:MAG: MFS transporter [Rhodobacteraceae bacterium]|nr:MFS transporter [Paracoccaceae bacterium]
MTVQQSSATKIDTTCTKWGPVWLAHGVSKVNAWTLMYAAFFTIGLLTFIGVGTPYVLNAVLKIPSEQQGVVSGNLVFWTEIISILFFGPVGVLADKFGRKPLYFLGFAIMGLGYALYPMAGSVAELTAYRIIYAIGVATSTGVLAVVVTDYPQEATRGKMVAIVGFMNGLGVAILNVVLGSIPKRLTESGIDEISAGQYTHWIVAGLCLLSAVVAGFGLMGGTPAKHEQHDSIVDIARGALKAAVNPRIALAYSAAFIARGDLVILGTFLTLWGTTAGVASGMEIAEASRRGTLVFVTAQSAALIWTGIVVFILDRFDRVVALAGCMFLATIGYLGMGLVSNPLDSADLPLIALLGIGQISAFFGSQALVGKEAPIRERGAVVGGFNMAGAVGILFCSVVGGQLFDAISPKAPFILVGALNALVFVMCLLVLRKSPPQSATPPAA